MNLQFLITCPRCADPDVKLRNASRSSRAVNTESTAIVVCEHCNDELMVSVILRKIGKATPPATTGAEKRARARETVPA
jgi:hypothetical protein